MRKLVIIVLWATLSAPALAASTQRTFWVWDLTVMPPAFRQPVFTEALVAPLSHDRLHIWVENGLKNPPGAETLARLVPLYTRAIELERPIFGDQPVPPTQDADIHMLIAAIPPYEKNGHKFGFDGFFNSFDQLTEAAATLQSQHSNEHDIIYVNALQDLTSDYMTAVVAHELNHLLTHARYDEATNPLDPWLNEMLGEAAMQLDGYFTDFAHVQSYRKAPGQPLAVEQFGINYGGLSLLAEYLMQVGRPERLGDLAPARGNAFERLERVYGRPWSELFAGYASWLFAGASSFPGEPVAVVQPQPSMKVAPTGVLFLPSDFEVSRVRIGTAPHGCSSSLNVVRTSVVSRGNATARAVWVESTPPCAVDQGGTKFDGFTLESGK